MRTIRKQAAPNTLTQWRMPRLAANRPGGMECTYAEMRRAPDVLAEAIQLAPFCFTIQPELEREIRKLEALRHQASQQ